jgi:hypothetical protein
MLAEIKESGRKSKTIERNGNGMTGLLDEIQTFVAKHR